MHRPSGRAPALGILLGLALSLAPRAMAEPRPMTVQTLVDRAEIEDLLTRYYYNLGHSSPEGFSAFYAPDAEMVLGGKSYRGKAAIEGGYRAAGASTPALKGFSFNVSLSNPLIVVHGTTATAQLIFTEIVIDTEGAAPRLLTQGREYDNLAKLKGQWRFTRRQILPGAQSPAGWTE